MDFRFDEFEIDLAQRELRRAGDAVHMEPQVFDLLVHLIRNSDRIVSKDELIETIWEGRFVSEAALSSRINAVRRALGDSGVQQSFIRTMHKRGFRFVGTLQSDGEGGEVDTRLAPVTEVPADSVGLAPSGDLEPAPTVGPSIAVVPFENLSADPENEYFSYGMTEDIIRLLARNRWLIVISRHSTIALKASGLAPREIGDALSVRYVLAGSVRKSGDRVRITAELLRAADGTQLWGDAYDLQLEDIFGIQEEMARQIAATIEPELSNVEQQLAARKNPDNLDAWDCYQRGLWHLWGFSTPGFDTAEQFFRRAAEIDPNFARAHGAVSYVNVQRALYDSARDRPATIETALRFGRTAVALDDRDCFCHCALGRALSFNRENEAAQAELNDAIELNPSFAQAFFAQGFNVLWGGNPLEAEALLDRATLLSPRDSHLWSFHHVRACAHLALEEFDLAAEFARRATRLPNVTYRAHATLTAALGLMGSADVTAAAAGLIEKFPDYTAETARQSFFFCNDEEFIQRFIAGLKAGGIPTD